MHLKIITILTVLATGLSAIPSVASEGKAIDLPKECLSPADENAADKCTRKYFVLKGEPYQSQNYSGIYGPA